MADEIVAESFKFYPSSIPSLNSWFKGYLRTVPVGFFGEGEAGKSIFMLQEATYLAKQLNKNVLLIGTEGGESVFASLWFPTFKNVFDYSGKIIVREFADIKSVLSAFGKDVEIQFSDKGKVDVRLLGVGKGEIFKEIIENNVGVLIFDSFTNLIRTEFSGGRANFPGRADAECLILDCLIKIARSGTFVLASHHATMDPTDPYRKPTVTGGKNIIHNFKHILYMEKTGFTAKEKITYRRIHLVRFFNLPPWRYKVTVNLTDKGFVEVQE